jgi:hypothetical protein
MASEGVTAAEKHHDGDGVGDAQRQFGVAQEYEWDYNREGRKETQQAKAQCSDPVAPRQSRMLEWRRQPLQVLPHQVQLLQWQN